MQIWKRKLCGRTLKAYQIRNKPNLDNIFKSYIGYHDLESLHNSLDYFERLQKTLFAMIRQLSFPTFFVTFTFAKRLWDPFIKVLQTLHASRLSFPNIMEDLQSVHITKLIWIDPITCAKYYDHKISCFHKLITKDHYLFWYISDFFLSLNSKIMEMNMLWIKKCTYVWSAHKWKNWKFCRHVYFL